MGPRNWVFLREDALHTVNSVKNPVSLSECVTPVNLLPNSSFVSFASSRFNHFKYLSTKHSFNIMSDRLTIISRSGRVFEMVNYWQVLFVNPPLQKSRSLDRTWYNMTATSASVGGGISVFASPLSRLAEPLRSPNLSLTSVSVVSINALSANSCI